jgi:hypothetical protein
MPLQNRVDPFGAIIATPARGMLMGNRGGRIHDPATRTLLRRRWASRQWICCVTEFKGRHRMVMGKGYTELFFLDEVTALAAGHRPCFECRRASARRFADLHAPGTHAGELDRLAHAERIGPRRPVAHGQLPDGVMVAVGDEAYALREGRYLRWSPFGYVDAVPVDGMPAAVLLTSRVFLGILGRGYSPVWHDSADRLIEGVNP